MFCNGDGLCKYPILSIEPLNMGTMLKDDLSKICYMYKQLKCNICCIFFRSESESPERKHKKKKKKSHKKHKR